MKFFFQRIRVYDFPALVPERIADDGHNTRTHENTYQILQGGGLWYPSKSELEVGQILTKKIGNAHDNFSAIETIFSSFESNTKSQRRKIFIME